jgi:hypothetical protein
MKEDGENANAPALAFVSTRDCESALPDAAGALNQIAIVRRVGDRGFDFLNLVLAEAERLGRPQKRAQGNNRYGRLSHRK